MTDAISAHRELSELSALFAEHLRRQPFMPGPLDSQRGMPLLNPWSVDQPVPLLVGRPFLERLEDATRRAGKLLVELPQRLARHSPELAARYWNMGSAAQAATILDSPVEYGNEAYRLDIVYGECGFKVLEVNMGAGASGFYAQSWLPFYLSNAVTADFIEQHGVNLYCKNTVDYFFDHLVDLCQQMPSVRAGGQAGLAMLTEQKYFAYVDCNIRQWFTETARKRGIDTVFFCIADEAELSYHDGGVSCDGMPVHVLVRNDGRGVSQNTFRACRAGQLFAYDGPTSFFSGDKRNFAMLTAQRDDALYDKDELATIAELIPWTSMMLPGPVRFEGEQFDLRELALHERERFVLKPARNYGGSGVSVGRYTEPAKWQTLIDEAMGDHLWLLQEYAASKPYVFHHPVTGFSDHDMVWGSFIIAGQAAGGTIRMKPRGLTDGVINVGRQGQEGLFCLHD